MAGVLCFGGSRELHRPSASRHPALVGMARYQTLQKIGEGMYGVVYRALDRITNEVCMPARARRRHAAQAPRRAPPHRVARRRACGAA